MHKAQKQQAILARDLLQLATEKWDELDIIERVSDYFFSLSIMFDTYDPDSPVNWHEQFTHLDTHYSHLRDDTQSHDAELFEKLRATSDLLQEAISSN